MAMIQPVAVLGGTGAEGSGLALRWAAAGWPILIGSRSVERAEQAAAALRTRLPPNAAPVAGLPNPEAARQARLVVLTVPFIAQAETLKSVRESLQPGSILVDCTVPLAVAVGGRPTRVLGVPQGSAAQQAAELVPPGVHVVSGFHHVGAAALAEAIPGARYVDAGPLENAQIVESITALLVGINLRYRVHASGLRIAGL